RNDRISQFDRATKKGASIISGDDYVLQQNVARCTLRFHRLTCTREDDVEEQYTAMSIREYHHYGVRPHRPERGARIRQYGQGCRITRLDGDPEALADRARELQIRALRRERPHDRLAGHRVATRRVCRAIHGIDKGGVCIRSADTLRKTCSTGTLGVRGTLS